MSTPHDPPRGPYWQQPQYPPQGPPTAYPPQGPPTAYPPQGPPTAYPPQGPTSAYSPGPYQRPSPGPGRRRHTARNVLLIMAGAMVMLIVLSAIGAALSNGHKPPHSTAGTAATVSAAPTTSAPPPPPTPNPAGTITGSCDVSLSSSLYGQNYLTAQANADNTGNIGTIVRVRVSWPLQGFAPITQTRTVRVAAGATSQVEFHAAVTQDQVSEFQDEQLSANGSDPCHYRGTITGTWGQPKR
jgi:hypothetical protein